MVTCNAWILGWLALLAEFGVFTGDTMDILFDADERNVARFGLLFKGFHRVMVYKIGQHNDTACIAGEFPEAIGIFTPCNMVDFCCP